MLLNLIFSRLLVLAQMNFIVFVVCLVIFYILSSIVSAVAWHHAGNRAWFSLQGNGFVVLLALILYLVNTILTIIFAKKLFPLSKLPVEQEQLNALILRLQRATTLLYILILYLSRLNTVFSYHRCIESKPALSKGKVAWFSGIAVVVLFWIFSWFMYPYCLAGKVCE